jgi:hypothetical protein
MSGPLDYKALHEARADEQRNVNSLLKRRATIKNKPAVKEDGTPVKKEHLLKRARKLVRLGKQLQEAMKNLSSYEGLLQVNARPQNVPSNLPTMKVNTARKPTGAVLIKFFKRAASHLRACGYEEVRGGKNCWTRLFSQMLEDLTTADEDLIEDKVIQAHLGWEAAVALLIDRFKRAKNKLKSPVLSRSPQGVDESVSVYTDRFVGLVQEEVPDDSWKDFSIFTSLWADGLHSSVRTLLAHSGKRKAAEDSFDTLTALAADLEADATTQNYLLRNAGQKRQLGDVHREEEGSPREKKKKKVKKEKADTATLRCGRCDRPGHEKSGCRSWYNEAGLRLPGIPPVAAPNAKDDARRCRHCHSLEHNAMWCEKNGKPKVVKRFGVGDSNPCPHCKGPHLMLHCPDLRAETESQ